MCIHSFLHVLACKVPADPVNREPLLSGAAKTDGVWFHGCVRRHVA